MISFYCRPRASGDPYQPPAQCGTAAPRKERPATTGARFRGDDRRFLPPRGSAKHFTLAVCLTVCLAVPAKAQTVAEFYKGKTIQIVVGVGVGGGYDLYARALGRFLGRHIPGQPTVVVQNMEGAGSVRAANYVYSGSPQDGTMIAAVNQNAPMYQLLGGAGARFEAAGMQWLGGMANSNGLVYTWHTSGIRTLDEAKLREVPVGAVGTASDSFIFPTILNELLGTKFKPIPGYAGSAQIHLAMERGEVMGRGGNSWASVQTANKGWVTEHKIDLLVQVGFEKEPELPDVPLLLDLVKSEEAISIVKVISLPTAIGLAHWVAPGVPKERVEALRAAYTAAVTDPEFRSEADRQGMVIRTQGGAALEAIVKQAAAAPKAMLAKTARILRWN
jgi:tripartite-type tricarboxylate transporter receptor subunit TctC